MNLENRLGLGNMKISGRAKLSSWLKWNIGKVVLTGVAATAVLLGGYFGLVHYQNVSANRAEKETEVKRLEIESNKIGLDEVKRKFDNYKQSHGKSNDDFSGLESRFEEYKKNHQQSDEQVKKIKAQSADYRQNHKHDNKEFKELGKKLIGYMARHKHTDDEFDDLEEKFEKYKQNHQHDNEEVRRLRAELINYVGGHKYTNDEFNKLKKSFVTYKENHRQTTKEFELLEKKLGESNRTVEKIKSSFEESKKRILNVERLEELVLKREKKLVELGKKLEVDVLPVSYELLWNKKVEGSNPKCLQLEDRIFVSSGNSVRSFELISGKLLSTDTGIINLDAKCACKIGVDSSEVRLEFLPKKKESTSFQIYSLNYYEKSFSLEKHENDHNITSITLRIHRPEYSDDSKEFQLEFRGRNVKIVGGKINFCSYKGMKYQLSNDQLSKISPQGDTLWSKNEKIKDFFFGDRQILILNEKNLMYSYDIFRGKDMWDFSPENGIKSKPFLHDRRVYVGAEDGHLYCLGTEKGNIVWKLKTDDRIREEPTIKNGYICFGSFDAYVYLLDVRDGKKLWMQELDSPISSPPIMKDDRLYFATTNGNLYCFEKKKK
ncbi:MAG: PQQ-binding-like beta-propeller repeat protein [Nanoarchaeota archaeon]|nr:PQQ-binding-like beta-propeller repeat protein [Nanoarchaeota archaeon]